MVEKPMTKKQRRDAARLAAFFRRNGIVRQQNPRRVAEEGWENYKKGDEVRLVADTPEELLLMHRLLINVGFEPGRPFRKGGQYRLPIYGRKEVARFLEMVDEVDEGRR